MQNCKKYLKTKGFTLIELMAVIAVVGILASVVMTNLSGAKETARDSERITEVGEIALGLELYYNQCRAYPSTLATTANNGCPTGVTLGSFLTSIPTDPGGGGYTYATGAGWFVVRATLETAHGKLGDDGDTAHHGTACNAQFYCKKG